VLILEQLQKSYEVDGKPIPILKGISVSFEKGEMVSLLGPSGCGKSTLLNVITGLDTIDEGDILYQNRSVKSFSENEWAAFRKNNIGYIFQSFNLISHLSVLENVEFSMTLGDVPREERSKRAKELLNKVGLADKYDYEPNRLSGGQKQRVAIARALANDPDIIVADEPTGALDSKTAIEIMEILKGLSEQGKLVILVTHSLEFAEWGTRIIKLQDGVVMSDDIKKEGTPSEEKEKKAKGTLALFSSMKLAGKNLKQKKWRTLLTSIGASIGIGGIALMVGLGIGAQSKVHEEIESLVDQRSVFIQSSEKNPKPVGQEKVDAVIQNSNVEGVVGAYQVRP